MLGKGAKKFLWINPLPTTGHINSRAQEREQLTAVLDSYRFNWRVWAVAASGLFAASFAFYATSVVLPALAFTYWPTDVDTDHEIAVNGVTLAGATVGQLFLGIAADKAGRQAIFGAALALIIVGTFSATQASSGVPYGDGSGRTSMSFFGWFLAWKFIMGIGIGGVAPLAAIIAAEWGSVRSRARLIAAVFIMQPIGQAVAYIIGLVALVALDKQYDLHDSLDQPSLAPVTDKLWRWVVGVAALPAIIAMAMRFMLPEPGRFVLDVQDDGERALMEAEAHYGISGAMKHATITDDITECGITVITEERTPGETVVNYNPQFTPHDMHQYFIKEGNWRYLVATSICWFVLDFAYGGLQINNPRLLAKLWANSDPQGPSTLPSWVSDSSQADLFGNAGLDIYDVMMGNIKNLLLTVSIAAICGGFAVVKMIHYLPRRRILVWSFLGTAILLAGTGAAFLKTFRTSSNAVTMIFYIAAQFVFNCGPLPLLFIITAEVFPTRYRGTCYGMSAASGRLGAILVSASAPYFTFGPTTDNRDLNSNALGWVMIIFAAILILGAGPSYAWLPEVQSSRRHEMGLMLPSKTLEELAEGRVRAAADGEPVGIRDKVRERLNIGGLIHR